MLRRLAKAATWSLTTKYGTISKLVDSMIEFLNSFFLQNMGIWFVMVFAYVLQIQWKHLILYWF